MGSLKNCHSQVGPKESQCLNVMWDPGAASGQSIEARGL